MLSSSTISKITALATGQSKPQKKKRSCPECLKCTKTWTGCAPMYIYRHPKQTHIICEINLQHTCWKSRMQLWHRQYATLAHVYLKLPSKCKPLFRQSHLESNRCVWLEKCLHALLPADTQFPQQQLETQIAIQPWAHCLQIIGAAKQKL